MVGSPYLGKVPSFEALQMLRVKMIGIPGARKEYVEASRTTGFGCRVSFSGVPIIM